MDKVDILNREEFIKQLITLTENISQNNNSVSFAIDGKWGCGKSFVLDMFEDKVSSTQSEETNTDKYFVVRYNCWKYDYYEEPLVSIVASLLDTIEQKTELVKEIDKSKIKGILKAIGTTLLSTANGVIKTATGVDVESAFDVIKDGIDLGKKEYEEMKEYDVYFSFNKALKSLREVLAEIGQTHTIVFLIDELDRCVPEYAIKVLERLHHLTEDTQKIISIVAIDKTQLQVSITKTFGFDNPEEYLKKFIRFSISLDCGEISNDIMFKYSEYIELFDKNLFVFDDSVEEFFQTIFNGIEIREQEQLVEKAKITHELLYSEKKDYFFMCMELLLTILICYYKNNMCFDYSTTVCDFYKVFTNPSSKVVPKFATFFGKKFENINFSRVISFEPKVYALPNQPLLYGSILAGWCELIKGWKEFRIGFPNSQLYNPIKNDVEELKKFVETIRLM